MRSSKRCPPGFDKLSEDLIYDILLRLPVKPLLRCKAVSKPWRCLISNPGFVDSHQARTGSGSGAESTLIIHNKSVSLLHLGPSQLVDDLQLPHCKSKYGGDTILVGSDRGIVCVAVCKSGWISFSEARYPTSIYLWNPATKHYKVIPPHRCYDKYEKVNVGFGFDPIDNDFKVVRVVGSPFPSEVYSANLNAWRKIGPIPTDIRPLYNFNVCINGLLCWTGDEGILAFDLYKEVFTCVTKFPKESTFSCITDFNNSIAVITGKGINGKINLWTLDDVECLRVGGVVEASWTLTLSIDTDVKGHSVHSYFNNGDMLLTSDDCKCFTYNSAKKETKEVPKFIDLDQVFKYKETLVSVTGFKQVECS
ncbi:F-box domain-containing protein [Heracleum sosnowskyi]|uniref:F-box domain-containing protein n=1 Tax=Heracleum sosnowskyi TaxID=360622 RepID=A0AAD8I475_9APIA|nr:F-box domain-containing protein [Heracleum sosnowskyi]